jgi:hypothetical protein
MEYTVTWTIEVDADSPREAAEAAREMMPWIYLPEFSGDAMRNDTLADEFEVRNAAGDLTLIHLNEIAAWWWANRASDVSMIPVRRQAPKKANS